jgi:NAD-dependent SIR2 family protein deacetylase
MGTSLAVQPFASLVEEVRSDVPRLLVNRERPRRAGFRPHARPDVEMLGDCDEMVGLLAEKLGWREELTLLMDSKRDRDE